MLRRAEEGGAVPKIAMLVTAQMASSNEDSNGKRSPGERRQRRWADALKKGREISAALNVDVECIDCAREDKPAELYREPLADAGCIWVTGGNTFYLWHWMKRSGVDELIKQRVLEQGAVYVGQSAGAIVAGSSIRTAFWKGWDDPGAAPDEDWSDDASVVGMGLVRDTSFFPHYEAAQWAGLVEGKKGEVARVICLTDDGEQSYVSGDDEP